MTLNPNQFGIETVQGQIDLQQGASNVISARVKTAEAAPLVAGQAVKLVDVAGGVPVVTATTADADETFGFVVRNLKDVSVDAEENLEIAIKGTILYMTAGAAIARGANVEVDVSELKVITSAGLNPIIGYAFDKAAADDDLIRVYIETPLVSAITGNQIASVNSYSAGAGALPITADVIALTTGGAEALTLADGVAGQELEIIMVVDGGAGTLTPANFGSGSTLTFDDVGDSARLRFVAGNWYVVGTATATLA